MSIDVMNRLWWRKDLSTMEKFVGLALADSASDDGVCWPAIATVAEKCSCSERTVQNAVKSLCGKQLLRQQHRKDRSSYYIFNIANLPVIERPRRVKELNPAVQTTGAGDAPQLFDTGESGSGTGAGDSMTGAGGAPRTIKEPSLETSTKTLGVLETPRGDLKEYILDRWEEIRSEHPRVAAIRKIDDGLMHTIEIRAKQHALDGETAIQTWAAALEAVETSRFLCGHAPPGPGRDSPFKLTLTWMAKATNFREILNGKYNSDRDASLYDERTGRRLGPTDQALAGSIARLRAARERGRGE